jgi:hypothetical protein
MRQRLLKYFVLLAAAWCNCQLAAAQRASLIDSIRTGKLKISQHQFINNFLSDAINSVEKQAPKKDIRNLHVKSESPYMRYQGKIIRHITIVPYNFDRNFKDTTHRDIGKLATITKRLHTETEQFVIRNNLFIKENTPLNAFEVADNERFIRTLEYLHDVRIHVSAIKNNPDSVDILVYTIDVISIAGNFETNWQNHFHANAYETNFGGWGHRLDLFNMYDATRVPNAGFGAAYKATNLFHSFTDCSLGFNNMNGNGFTHQEDQAVYLTLNRPLYSAYSRFAGNVTFSTHAANNLYHIPDSSFFKYRYTQTDMWIGYNPALQRLNLTNTSIRDRRFLSVRYLNTNFDQMPYQIGTRFNSVYNNAQAALAKITFFRQDYYKTDYIYGFGTTEDLPYGYNLSFTSGWYRQLTLDRAYFGINAYNYHATAAGDFLEIYLKASGYEAKTGLQDRSLMIGATAFSRILYLGGTKVRQYVNLSYSRLDNIVTSVPLKINNDYGLRGFLSDSVYGRQRLSLQSETEFFVPWSKLGFHFCPFPYLDMSVITPENQPLAKSSLYCGLGGGVRIRNEKLVFETIEIKAFYFPVVPNSAGSFKIDLSTNVRYRYTSNFITPPDLIQLNNSQ